jgi:hypothetical protein
LETYHARGAVLLAYLYLVLIILECTSNRLH